MAPEIRLRLLAYAMVVVALGTACGSTASGHEIPGDVTIHAFVKPEGERLRLLVRVPLEAMRDVTFPLQGPGYLDVERADDALAAAATLWIANELVVYEGERELPRATLLEARASIPSDRSFETYDAALAHVLGEPLPPGIGLVWQQALLDALLEVPIESEDSRFALRTGFEQLGLRVVTVVRFLPPSGPERLFEIRGEAGPVLLDPEWHQAAARFVREGFAHILDGLDHLLFIFCLVMPFRGRIGALVGAVTAFTVAHSITLIASAYGWAPTGLWFAPLIETLIAATIFYMALENILQPRAGARWISAFGFGLIHGFGFSFALRETLQFAGDHALSALLSFNLGVELGQLLVLALLIPALGLLFRWVPERMGIIVLSVLVAHTAWHWLAERFEVLRQFPVPWAELERAMFGSALPWLAAAMLAVLAVAALLRRRQRAA